MIDNVILFGSTGMLGRYILSYFSKRLNVYAPSIRIRDGISVYDIETELKKGGINENTCVINCIGSIPQRNRDPRIFYIVNGVFPHVLSTLCSKYGAKMIQPSTDCVFNGTHGGYIETDLHDESIDYGMSKSIGEPAECMVIRTSIIGEELHNKRSFLEFVRTSRGDISCWENHMWNGITCLEYCKLIETIFSTNSFWTGVRHVFSPRSVSKYEMACMIRDAYNLDIRIRNVSTTQSCNKTLNSVYPAVFTVSDLKLQIEELRAYNLNTI